MYRAALTRLGFHPRPGSSDHLLTEVEIQQMEAKLGYSLSQDYRQFLKECPDMLAPSGMSFYYDTPDGKQEGSVRILYGSTENKDLAVHYDSLRQVFDSDENCTLEMYSGVSLLREIDSSLLDVGWPEELLPIGVDPGGNDICIAFKGLRLGAIFLRMANPLPEEQNLYFVADSFKQFIHMLKRSGD